MTPSTALKRTMSSREISDLTGKKHNNVVRDIINMFKGLELRPEGYAQNWVHPQNGQTYVEYMLDQDLTTCLLTGYDVKARMKVIKRWKELENKHPSLPNFNNPVEAARAWADEAEQKQCALDKIAEDAPKVEYMDRFVDSNGLYTFTKVAKIFSMQRKKFLAMLQSNSIIYKQGGDWLPCATYEKHFEVKTGVTNDHAWCQSRVTSAGLVWMTKRFSPTANAPALKAVK